MANVYQVSLGIVEDDSAVTIPVTDRVAAQRVSEVLDWVLEDGFPDDPPNGIWHCSIPSQDEMALEQDGYLFVTDVFGPDFADYADYAFDPDFIAVGEIEL